MRSENRAGRLLLLPMGLLLTALALVPIAGVLGLSLQKRMPIFQISEFVGLANYRFLLSDPRFWSALKNTLLFTAASVSLELAIGLGIALLLQRGSRLGPVRAVVLIPWVIPTVVTAKMWEWIYHPGFGILNYLLGTDINWLGDPRWAMPAAIMADVWKTTPFVVILFVAGLQVIPRDLYLAALVDGASGLQIFRSITLPLLKPVILIVLLFRTLDAFRVFDTIYVLTGGGPANTTETLSIYAYKVLFQILEFGYGSALAVATFFAVMIISLVYIRILKRRPA
ncbi:MAG TPA: sugar ABC transporter permease [Candidatus Manganitrophaceae bacterium]|nr:sugar ABC transporter permease [Candidatus Manganitrophaceae bacterium]